MILGTAKVDDFDRFWQIFSTKGAELRKEHGSKGAQVFRDPEDPNRVFAVAFGAALALAGAAGSLLMPFYSAYPFVGQVFVLMAFVAVVLGTLGNVIGALVASLMMGVAESLGIQFVGADSGLIVVFAMLLLTLAFKPTGLGGGRAR